MKNQDVIVSGIQPTGRLHLGNYFAAIRQWLRLQDQGQCIFSIVDLHAMTVSYDPKTFQRTILEAGAELLAAGINPKKSILFIQSRVHEHSELAWLLTTMAPLGELERMTQFKEKQVQHAKNIQAGLLNYPLLMAADILLYKANLIPVGEDQLQHVEFTRMMMRKFHHLFGKCFPEPKALLSKGERVMSLADPAKKMSKSFGDRHVVSLSDPPEVIREKVMSAVTDSGPLQGKRSAMSPGVQNLFTLLELSAGHKAVKPFEEAYQNGTIRYQELKSSLADAIVHLLVPLQEKRRAILEDQKSLVEILEDGARRARAIAAPHLHEIKKKMGLL